jgi:energy-coupling factor transporter ATP-binding protein EcfA2
VTAWCLAEAWRGDVPWTSVIPEGLDDVTLHGEGYECRAQIKSRRDPQSSFSIAEVAEYIAKAARSLPRDWQARPGLRLALLLERRVEGLATSGWDTVIGNSSEVDGVRESLVSKLDGTWRQHAGDLLSRIHLVVEAEPMERGLDALSSDLGPRAADLLALHGVREQAGRAADSNGAADIADRVELGRSDVQRQLDDVQGIVAPGGYLELTSGLCEIADFEQEVSEDAFHEGVNVLPGHVGAGLVFEREGPTAELLQALETQRYALVAGPSGAGKSALAWLAAYATRHETRWYRVRGLQIGDVSQLARLAKLLNASTRRPLGFVIDDVGRPETAGWDAFVTELPALPGVVALGTVREEDLFVLSTAISSVVVRPVLDETLATRIWSALDAAGKAAFSFWREPFERSRGLLLEYTHLLSNGRRLEETLAEQVRRRLAEDRGDELVLLRTVAFAAALGGAVDSSRLRAQAGYDEPRFAKALRRLIDEHAVRQRDDGALTGLHEIRSTYLDTAVRECLGTPQAEVLASAVDVVTSDTIAAVIVGDLRRSPEDEGALLDALSARLADTIPEVWTGIFHGLGLATADQIAAHWLEISRAADIEDRFSGMMLMLALASSDLSDAPIFAKLKVAQAAFDKSDVPDLRGRLAALIPEGAAMPEMDLEQVHQFAASLVQLAGCKQGVAIPVRAFGDLSGAPLVPLLELLRTLAALNLPTAEEAIASAGGTEVLLERIYSETPWVTRPELGVEDGIPIVTAHVRSVHPEVQDDLNRDVFRLCELMGAAAPHAEFVCAQARFPDGSLAGYGDFAIAEKRVPRENLTAPVRVAWNRSQMRALHRLVAAPDLTGRETALSGAIGELAAKLVEGGDFYCRMKQPGPRWRLFLQVRAWLTDFIQPASADDSIGRPLDRGGGVDSDSVHGFVTGLQRLIGELTDGISAEPILMAARTAGLARDAAALGDPGAWRMTSKPPMAKLREMEAALWDIRAVLGDVGKDPDRRGRMAARYGTTSQRHNTLHRAAEDSRRRAEQSLAERREEIRKAFEDQGLNVVVVSRPAPKDDGWAWPDVDFAVLVKVDALLDFLLSEADFLNAAGAVPGRPRLEYAPVLEGKIAPYSMTYVNEQGMPGTGLKSDWEDELPYPFLEDPNHQLFTEAFDAATTLSAIAIEKGRGLNEVEQAFFDQLVERFIDRTGQLVAKLDDGPDEVLSETVAFLSRLALRVQAEINGESEGEPLSVEALAPLRGQLNDVSQHLIAIRLMLLDRAARLGDPVAENA